MSNRSSHFVRRLQTLPSALAGASGPKRLLALAVVLALLALMLQAPNARAQMALPDPEDPRNLSALVVLNGVELRWLPPEDGLSVDGYEIWRRASGEDELTVLVSNTGAADTRYTDTTATENGVLYRYRVKAIRDGERSDWSNVAMVLRSPAIPPLVSNIGQSESSSASIDQQYAQGFRFGDARPGLRYLQRLHRPGQRPVAPERLPVDRQPSGA